MLIADSNFCLSKKKRKEKKKHKKQQQKQKNKKTKQNKNSNSNSNPQLKGKFESHSKYVMSFKIFIRVAFDCFIPLIIFFKHCAIFYPHLKS